MASTPPHRKLNPLDLPEIIARIGQFLPLWSGEGFQREFDPRPLLRCSLVSRSFRAALLPTLWYLYDGYRMRNIPQHILIKYSPYFRIITSTGPFKGPFRCRNLIELSTVYGQEWSRDLLVSNPGLKRLVWGGPFHRRIETLEQQQEWELELKALLGLENLDEFRTTGFSLGEGIFVKVLRNNAARLSNLTLSTVAGVTSIKGLELPHLTELHVTLGCVESPALVDLLRCCPRLQRLSLMGSMAKGSSTPPPPPAPAHMHQQPHLANDINDINPLNNNNSVIVNDRSLRDHEISRLAQNIAECCPELSSIKFTTSSQSCLVPMHRNHSSSQLFLSGDECAALVNATSRLESFSAELMTLDYTLTEALVAQASSFKSLQLTFRRTDSELSLEPRMSEESRIREVHCLRRLKASLHRLKELSLMWDERPATAAISTLDLFQEPTTLGMTSELRKELVAFMEEAWATSQGLESLAIRGLFPTTTLTTSTVSHGAEGCSSAPPSEPIICWRPVKVIEPYEDRLASVEQQDGDAILRLLLSSLDTQTRLGCLTLNRMVYERVR
ncbi:hypothetical protein EC968_002642 [Mortierella alpina]|nr:hypothetical protein EC968_002642 [Mortierella alpina]